MIAIRTFVCDATARIDGEGKIVVSGAFFHENTGCCRSRAVPVPGAEARLRGLTGLSRQCKAEIIATLT